MSTIITRKELFEHPPEVRDGLIIGCLGCEWTASMYRAAGSEWFQYLRHLKTFEEEGALCLSSSDMRLLEDHRRACEGPAKSFTE